MPLDAARSFTILEAAYESDKSPVGGQAMLRPHGLPIERKELSLVDSVLENRDSIGRYAQSPLQHLS